MNRLYRQLFRLAGFATSRSINKLLEKDPGMLQEKVLKDITKTNQNTVFGRKHKFTQITSIEDYQEQVPVSHIDEISPYLDWVKQGNPDVLARGYPIYWLQTSGSTGTPKQIPYNKAMVKRGHSAALRSLLSYLGEDKSHLKLLEGQMLGIAASHHISDINNVPVGYVSGLISMKTQALVSDFIVPNESILKIPEWEARHHAIIDSALKSDIRGFAGVTPFVINTLQMITAKLPDELVEVLTEEEKTAVKPVPRIQSTNTSTVQWQYEVEESIDVLGSNLSVGTDDQGYVLDKMMCRLDDIWPNVQLFISSGVQLDLYYNWLLELLGPIDFPC